MAGNRYSVNWEPTYYTRPARGGKVEVPPPSVKQLGKRSALLDYKCGRRGCKEAIKVGDVVFDAKFKVNDMIHHNPFHLHCLQKMVDKAPKPKYVLSFEELRAKILETGKVFPDEQD